MRLVKFLPVLVLLVVGATCMPAAHADGFDLTSGSEEYSLRFQLRNRHRPRK